MEPMGTGLGLGLPWLRYYSAKVSWELPKTRGTGYLIWSL